MRVHQIMTRKVTTVKADMPIVEAANLMLNHHISGLPVVGDTGKLVGIVSEGDFIRHAKKAGQVAQSPSRPGPVCVGVCARAGSQSWRDHDTGSGSPHCDR